MAYGTLFVLILVLVARHPPSSSPTRWTPAISSRCSISRCSPRSSASASYLTIIQRIGADRAAYTSVLFPVVALGVSTWLEGFSLDLARRSSACVLVLAGNLLVLVRRRGRRRHCRASRPSGNNAACSPQKIASMLREALQPAAPIAHPARDRSARGFPHRRGVEAGLRGARRDRPVGRRGRSADAGLHLRCRRRGAEEAATPSTPTSAASPSCARR